MTNSLPETDAGFVSSFRSSAAEQRSTPGFAMGLGLGLGTNACVGELFDVTHEAKFTHECAGASCQCARANDRKSSNWRLSKVLTLTRQCHGATATDGRPADSAQLVKGQALSLPCLPSPGGLLKNQLVLAVDLTIHVPSYHAKLQGGWQAQS